MTAPKQAFGRGGEDLARTYLEGLGYCFVAANWRTRSGELDLVMRDQDVLVFVEVKTRRGEGAGRAEEGISPAQARRILTTAELFVMKYQDLQISAWRVDLVAVTFERGSAPARITHWPDAVVTG
jgi:putative endonuclease